MREALTFDDVLLVPKYSDVLPSQVDISTEIAGLNLKIPILSAAMDTVTEWKMAMEMARLGGLGVIHKNMTPEEQAEQILRVKREGFKVAGALGTSPDTLERAEKIVRAGVDLLVVDTAHGHSKRVIDTVKELKRSFPDVPVMAGNVATGEGARDLISAGADVVKVGVGPGSICTTRLVAGVGVPQMTAIFDAVVECKKHGVPIVADGGIRYPGDVVKALAAGASAVMIGSLLAGTDESPGKLIVKDGVKYKYYRGMGSVPAMKKGSADRYFKSGSGKMVPEGVEALVPYRGSLRSVLDWIVVGIRSGFGYIGARNIEELWEKAEFVRITHAGYAESQVHDVMSLSDIRGVEHGADS